ncbi:MAG: hypothetical protein ACK56F_03625 [bacterium]
MTWGPPSGPVTSVRPRSGTVLRSRISAARTCVGLNSILPSTCAARRQHRLDAWIFAFQSSLSRSLFLRAAMSLILFAVFEHTGSAMMMPRAAPCVNRISPCVHAHLSPHLRHETRSSF